MLENIVQYICLAWILGMTIYAIVNRLLSYTKRARELAEKERTLNDKEKELCSKECNIQSLIKIRDEDTSTMRDVYLQKERDLQKNHQKRIDDLEKSYKDRLNAEVNEHIQESLSKVSQRPYFKKSRAFYALSNTKSLIVNDRFFRATREPISISSSLSVSAEISSNDKTYHTTLDKCDCDDYYHRKIPCKHMLRLAIDLGLLASIDTSAFLNAYTEHYAQLQEKIKELQKATRDYERNQKIMAEIKSIRSSSFDRSSAWLAQMLADYFDVEDQRFTARLMSKNRPAIKAAERMTELRKEKREAIQKYKLLEYQLLLYESLFPWLPEYRTVTPSDVERLVELSGATDESGENEYSSMRHWLSPDEYASLSSCEKYQLALDRYMSRSKSNWEIGIEYERYVGYLYEQDGYTVTYSGALQKLEDMGRDLIAQKGDVIHVVQCKRWAKEKVIHEKHIFQLYGTCILLTKEHPWHTIVPVFYTTTELSDTAKYCAKKMGVQIHDNCQYNDYPMIKCNISKSGEKIYHLPFDMQYDRIIIEKENGESYVRTVAEAEALGFRRAHRWSSRQGETVAASSAE